jgi:16S rRNA (adenine1518-N6/adenine1519-N6)-dimethyltransferase
MKRKRLGQHYLVDDDVRRRMLEVAGIGPGERVLEIGTGRGELSKELVSLGRSFEGYEIDKANYEATLEAVGQRRRGVHLGDAFERRPVFDVLVASLPYSQSSAFIEWQSQLVYDRAVVLLQEDFVRKALAPPGSRDYRAISALAQLSAHIEVVSRVERKSFSPPPKVNSVMVRITPRLRLSAGEISNIKRLFSLRRRTVASVLAELGMEGEGYGTRRVYSLLPGEVHALCAPKSS